MNAILTNFLPWLVAILGICATIGAMSAFRNGRQVQLMKFQEDTNRAQKNRIDAMEGRIDDLERENAVQQHLIDTLIQAFRQEGKVVTLDGDLVTIKDQAGRVTNIRKRPATPARVKKEKDEDEA